MSLLDDPSEAGPSGDWVAEHIADVDAQIKLVQSLVDAGETTLAVNLPNYLSLHRYLHDVLALHGATEQEFRAYRQRMLLAQALRDWKRPRGRPRKIVPGLLSGGGRPAAPPNPKGRPIKYSDDFFRALNGRVESIASNARDVGIGRGMKAALGRVMVEIVESESPTGEAKKRARDAEAMTEVFYKPLMKYRKKVGLRLRAESQKPRKNAPDFGPLQRFFRG